MDTSDFTPLVPDSATRLALLEKIVQEMAEYRMALQLDLNILKEQYELQSKELEYYKSLALPEQRQLYRILKNN